jgi:hypothetical protein
VYQFPHDFDTTLFLGKTLEMFCFTKNQFTLHLSGECLLQIESEIDFKRIKRSASTKLPRSDLINLYNSLEKEITGIEVENSLHLYITFGNEFILRINNHPQFESAHILLNGRTTII